MRRLLMVQPYFFYVNNGRFGAMAVEQNAFDMVMAYKNGECHIKLMEI